MAIISQTTSAGEVVEKRAPSALWVGMKTGAATVENSMEFPRETNNGSAFWNPAIPLLGLCLRILKYQFKRIYAPQCVQQHYLQ